MYQQPAHWGNQQPGGSGYQQPEVWGVNPGAVGTPALMRTAAEHMRPGETLFGAFSLYLDPLLPLYFHAERFKQIAVWIPFLWLWDLFRSILSTIKVMVTPRWIREIFGVTYVRYSRQFGLNPFRRLYRAIRRPLHGGSWNGARGSTAWQIWKAVRLTPFNPRPYRVRHELLTLAVTDQRLLLLSLEDGSFTVKSAYHAVPLFELPRGTYALRPEVPNSWWTHRLDLVFGDGSWIAFEVPGKWTLDGDEAKEHVQQITSLLR